MGRRLKVACVLSGLLAGLSACAVPPYDAVRRGEDICQTVTPRGFLETATSFATSRPCTAFERHWFAGPPRRLAVSSRGEGHILITEESGAGRSVHLREVRPGYWCALSRSYPEAVTRQCRAVTAQEAAVLRVRG